MKRFHFPLEGLYRWRKEEERQAVMVVQGLQMQENEILGRISEIDRLRAEWVTAYNQRAMKEESQADLLIIEKYFAVLDQAKAHEELGLKKIREKLRVATEAARQAYRAMKQVEHLREERRRKFDEELRLHERKSVDEINSLRFVVNDQQRKEGRL